MIELINDITYICSKCKTVMDKIVSADKANTIICSCPECRKLEKLNN